MNSKFKNEKMEKEIIIISINIKFKCKYYIDGLNPFLLIIFFNCR